MLELATETHSAYVHVLEQAQECLANVVYHEARGTSLQSQKAVAYVVVNRAKNPKYGGNKQYWLKHVCKVAYAPNQFAIKKPPTNSVVYQQTKAVSLNVLKENYKDNSLGALYFHNGSVKPTWSLRKQFLFKLEGHWYYK